MIVSEICEHLYGHEVHISYPAYNRRRIEYFHPQKCNLNNDANLTYHTSCEGYHAVSIRDSIP